MPSHNLPFLENRSQSQDLARHPAAWAQVSWACTLRSKEEAEDYCTPLFIKATFSLLLFCIKRVKDKTMARYETYWQCSNSESVGIHIKFLILLKQRKFFIHPGFETARVPFTLCLSKLSKKQCVFAFLINNSPSGTFILYFTVVISAFQSTSNYLASWDLAQWWLNYCPGLSRVWRYDSRLWWCECACVYVLPCWCNQGYRQTPPPVTPLSPGGKALPWDRQVRRGNGRREISELSPLSEF